MKTTNLFTDFFNSEKTSGLILMVCATLSLILANAAGGESYQHFWHAGIFNKPIEFWINDGLMTLFFLLVGLEIEREIYVGEFSDLRKAALPILAAIGGMLIPAAIHFGFNHGTDYENGFGVPMATDIAFSLAILSMLGRRVPVMLKVFLTALAIMDDLGAILVIAIFYAEGVAMQYLGFALGVFIIMLLLNRGKVDHIWIYALLGIALWYCLYQAGIHPTISGVLLAFAIPFRNSGENDPSYRLQHLLHKPVAFIVLPVFALANTAIPLSIETFGSLTESNSLGIILGLLAGKPLGILLFSLLGIALGICTLPQGIKKSYILGIGLLAGIGFTMSIFITLLAFPDPATIVNAKVAVVFASITAGLAGYTWLRFVLPSGPETDEQEE